ncbi:MAG: hypothetical protein L0Z49_00150 [Actinobacteria bacterium]|nr:hypothetical protein [Actinomycetota bacterium]MCI0542838.1 hypothetical protein [Actinomycetota bacterium]
MKRSWSRLVAPALLLVGMTTVVALPVLGQEEGETTETTAPATGTTLPAEQIDPAVPVGTAAENPPQPDWTYRYLIPTGLVLAVIVVLMTSIRYFTNVVRKRYRIIEE